MHADTSTCYAFIDAANLFYGGEKNLGWKIDYLSLKKFLENKYGVSHIYYFAGVRLFNFSFSPVFEDKIDLANYLTHLEEMLKKESNLEARLKIKKQFGTAKFYRKLEEFRYMLCLKPAKEMNTINGFKIKANCDVDLTFEAMRLKQNYNKVVVMTGDGDFLVLLKYLVRTKNKVTVIGRSRKTAREIKQLMKSNFVDFDSLRSAIETKK